jgi:hypothetical protein
VEVGEAVVALVVAEEAAVADEAAASLLPN